MASPVSTDRTHNRFFSRTESGGLAFHYFEPFDRNTNESDDHYGEFPRDVYEEGKKQLSLTGCCNISANNCTLEIKRAYNSFKIYFCNHFKSLFFQTDGLEGFL